MIRLRGKEEGKSDAVIEKMVEGALDKFKDEVVSAAPGLHPG